MSKLELKVGDRIVWAKYRGLILDTDINYETPDQYCLLIIWEVPQNQPSAVWRTIPVAMVSLCSEQLSMEEKLTHDYEAIREAARTQEART